MVITKERGVPVPSPSVMARLHAIDASFEMRPYRMGDSGIQWAVVCPWPTNNPKWARVQSGEIDPATALDIIAWAPLELNADEVPAYVERGLIGLDSGTGMEHIRAALFRIRRENQKAPEQRWAKVIDRAMEDFDRHASLASPDVIRVAGIDLTGGAATPARPRKKKSQKPPKAAL